jgi:hypothetical protein
LVGFHIPKFTLDDFLSNLGEKSQGFPGKPLGRPVPESFSGLTKFRPAVNIGGGVTGRNIPARLPSGEVNIRENKFNVGGRLGFAAETIDKSKFGAGIKGDWERGALYFPEELQREGAPETEIYGRGVNLGALDAFYETPEGTRYKLQYNPNDKEIYANVKLNF